MCGLLRKSELYKVVSLDFCQAMTFFDYYRAVGRSENPGVPVLFGGHNLPPVVEIGITDLPKYGDAMAPPAPPGTTGLVNKYVTFALDQGLNRLIKQ